jgi:hypothetical protein
MGKRIWVLDHETKGTGAEMVPLDKKQGTAERASAQPQFVVSKTERPAIPPPPRPAARFRVEDVMTRRELGADLDGKALMALLAGVRSAVDVTVSVRRGDDDTWRPVPVHQRRLLWERARR